MLDARTLNRPRTFAIFFVLMVHLFLAYAFVTGLALTVIERVSNDLKTFDVAPPAPPAPAPEPAPAEAASEPTPLEASTEAVPTRANPAAASTAGEARPGLASGATSGNAASLLRGSFNNESDYPSAARRREEQGTVQVRFTVGPDGRVGGCTVVRSSGSSSLDSTTCRIFERRFRYSPARDGNGNPVSQSVTQSVSWQLT